MQIFYEQNRRAIAQIFNNFYQFSMSINNYLVYPVSTRPIRMSDAIVVNLTQFFRQFKFSTVLHILPTVILMFVQISSGFHVRDVTIGIFFVPQTFHLIKYHATRLSVEKKKIL